MKGIDITGKKFGSLTVIKQVEKPSCLKSAGAYFLCQCDCGRTKIIMGKSLREGKTKTCGCHIDKITDISNQRFGRLTALKIDNSVENRGNGAYWICRCDCGNFISVQASNLKNGNVSSCGCLISKGEEEIRKLLVKNNIKFLTQYSFSDLKSELGYPLRFDFAIFNKEALSHLIEFQGEQHYSEKSKFFDNRTLITDKIKKDYCKMNNIMLIEIPYKKLGKITLKDLGIISERVGEQEEE